MLGGSYAGPPSREVVVRVRVVVHDVRAKSLVHGSFLGAGGGRLLCFLLLLLLLHQLFVLLLWCTWALFKDGWWLWMDGGRWLVVVMG